jgi:hypothetical protein
MTLKNARITVLLDDPQLAYHLGQLLMKSGAFVYSKSQVERYMACGQVLEVDAEISDNGLQLLDPHY